MRSQSRRSLTAITVALAGAAAPAQEAATPQLLDAYGLRAASVQSIGVERSARGLLSFEVLLEGRRAYVVATAHELRTPDFAVWLDDGRTLTRGRRTELATYRGQIRGLARSRVAVSILDGRISAVIDTGTARFGIEPIPEREDRDAHVVFAVRDLLPDRATCREVSVGSARSVALPSTPSLASNARFEAEIAVDCDNAWFNRKGRSSTRVQNDVLRVLNAVSAIYERDVQIRYRLTSIVIRTAKVYTGTSTGALLGQMRSRWNNQHRAIRRDVAHLFTGVGSNFGGVVGTGYVGVVCSSSAYGVSKVYASALARNAGLVCHELGHNWNARHCNSSNPCYIMCSNLSGCARRLTLFGTQAKGQIARHRDSRGCLTRLNPGTYVYSGKACTGSSKLDPQFSVVGLPALGKSFLAYVRDANPAAPMIIGMGASSSRWGALSLPLDLAPLGAPGCQLAASLEIQVAAIANGFGSAEIRFVVPSSASLLGVRFFNQCLVVDRAANALGLVLTRAGVGTIGN